MTLIVYDYIFLCTALQKEPLRKMWQGTFGPMLKGLLPDSKLVPVHKLQGMKQGDNYWKKKGNKERSNSTLR